MTPFAHPAVPSAVAESLRATWDHLARPGASWSGAERVAIAAAAREARGGETGDTDLPAAAREAAELLGARPGSARREWVERITADLGDPRFVELVAIVSRLVAVDTFVEALSVEHEPLPGPADGDPTGDVDHRARRGAAWVPMVGGASITQSLSLVPSENAELERFHGPMYMTFAEMEDPGFRRGLHRPQMELVAARTSAFNECFY